MGERRLGVGVAPPEGGRDGHEALGEVPIRRRDHDDGAVDRIRRRARNAVPSAMVFVEIGAVHAPRPRSAHQRPPEGRARHHADHDVALVLQGDERAPAGVVPDVVVRPVDAVDDPSAPRRTRVPDLLAEEAVVGSVDGEQVADPLFDGPIDWPSPGCRRPWSRLAACRSRNGATRSRQPRQRAGGRARVRTSRRPSMTRRAAGNPIASGAANPVQKRITSGDGASGPGSAVHIRRHRAGRASSPGRCRPPMRSPGRPSLATLNAERSNRRTSAT